MTDPLPHGTRFAYDGDTYVINGYQQPRALTGQERFRGTYHCFRLTRSPLGPHRLAAATVHAAIKKQKMLEART